MIKFLHAIIGVMPFVIITFLIDSGVVVATMLVAVTVLSSLFLTRFE
jgi:hypothetical protein